ncbi:DUF4179 domain-containing protein [Lederbergia graminis]|uniref:DUF4179 domain-containing protein n=1 Tax=Lederbergia graminis TaxID=735518 RepID=A0ABW0LKV1_9BACI
MDNIEKKLIEEKRRMDKLEAPLELESRLRHALQKKSKRNWRYKKFPTLVASLLLIVFVSYHFNAFAYYGKKILGFDEVLSGTLQDLNDAGKGQIIEKTYPLGSGAELTINGIMSDENRMILYYTVFNPNGLSEPYNDIFQPEKITGFFTSSDFKSSNGVINDEDTELKGTMDFETPSPFSKQLTLHYQQYLENGEVKAGKVTFPYDPNKAMQTNIKQDIKKTVKVDKGKITFNSIVASPTLTVIKGKLDVDNLDKVHLDLHGIELIANGQQVDIMGSGHGTTLLGGKEFDVRFDALPLPLDSLVLNVKEFVGYKEIDQAVSLQKMDDEPINLDGEKLWIKDIAVSTNGLEVTIVTDESTLLDGVYVESKIKKTPLEKTINQTLLKESGQLLNERTLVFNTREIPETLFISGIHYMKEYKEKIEIPVKK